MAHSRRTAGSGGGCAESENRTPPKPPSTATRWSTLPDGPAADDASFDVHRNSRSRPPSAARIGSNSIPGARTSGRAPIGRAGTTSIRLPLTPTTTGGDDDARRRRRRRTRRRRGGGGGHGGPTPAICDVPIPASNGAGPPPPASPPPITPRTMLPSYESYSSSSARHCQSTCDAYARSGRPDRLGGITPHSSRPRGRPGGGPLPSGGAE